MDRWDGWTNTGKLSAKRRIKRQKGARPFWAYSMSLALALWICVFFVLCCVALFMLLIFSPPHLAVEAVEGRVEACGDEPLTLHHLRVELLSLGLLGGNRPRAIILVVG